MSDFDNRDTAAAYFVVRLDAQRRGTHHAGRLCRADEGGSGADLLRHRAVARAASEVAAPGGVQGQGLRGAAAHRPGRRDLGGIGDRSSTVNRSSRSPRARWTSAPRMKRRRRSRARGAGKRLRRPAELVDRDVGRACQAGAVVHASDPFAGLPGRRHLRHHPAARAHVPGFRTAGSGRETDSRTQPDASAGHRPATAHKAAATMPNQRWPKRPNCFTAPRFSPKAMYPRIRQIRRAARRPSGPHPVEHAWRLVGGLRLAGRMVVANDLGAQGFLSVFRGPVGR